MKNLREEWRLERLVAEAIVREARVNHEVRVHHDHFDVISAQLLARAAIEAYRKEVSVHG